MLELEMFELFISCKRYFLNSYSKFTLNEITKDLVIVYTMSTIGIKCNI